METRRNLHESRDGERTGDESNLALAVSLGRNGGSAERLHSGGHGEGEGALVPARGLSSLKVGGHDVLHNRKGAKRVSVSLLCNSARRRSATSISASPVPSARASLERGESSGGGWQARCTLTRRWEKGKERRNESRKRRRRWEEEEKQRASSDFRVSDASNVGREGVPVTSGRR